MRLKGHMGRILADSWLNRSVPLSSAHNLAQTLRPNQVYIQNRKINRLFKAGKKKNLQPLPKINAKPVLRIRKLDLSLSVRQSKSNLQLLRRLNPNSKICTKTCTIICSSALSPFKKDFYDKSKKNRGKKFNNF